MRGERDFRQSSKSYIQFANEIYVYTSILAAFKEVMEVAEECSVKVEDLLPKCYVAEFGYIEGSKRKFRHINIYL